MTKAQQTYERINALVDGGMQKAEAFKQLAEENSQPPDSIRGAYYTHARTLKDGAGGARRPRKRETTPQDAVEQAIATLRRAIENIDAEITAAKTRAEEAQAEYQALKQSAGQRTKEIETKITALQA